MELYKNFIYINDKINEYRKKNLINFIYRLILILFSVFIILKKNQNDYKEDLLLNEIVNCKDNDLMNFNKNCLFKYLNDSEYFRITFIKYSFSFKYNIIKIEYNLGFYDINDKLILPSSLPQNKNFEIICNILINDKESIDSLANIYKNKYFNCIEFCLINENIKFGIKIYQIKQKKNYLSVYYFTDKIFNFNNLNNHLNNKFEPIIINSNYNSYFTKIIKKKDNKNLLLKKSYMKYPFLSLKRDSAVIKGKWFFKNIYNDYFCFCIGFNCLGKNTTKCKYNYYLSIIDNNKQIYPKTEYLFFDFLFADLSSDDVFPIFQKMIQLNFSVHYITEKKEIYNQYCMNIKECLIILPVKKEYQPINGDFLEKYLILFLKIKVVVSGRGTTFNTNIFYNIDYITYISVGHGVCYFKYFLYSENRIYGKKKNNKILLPPSEKIILISKKYGWEDKDIIKINLPRWDKYNLNKNIILISDNKIKKILFL